MKSSVAFGMSVVQNHRLALVSSRCAWYLLSSKEMIWFWCFCCWPFFVARTLLECEMSPPGTHNTVCLQRMSNCGVLSIQMQHVILILICWDSFSVNIFVIAILSAQFRAISVWGGASIVLDENFHISLLKCLNFAGLGPQKFTAHHGHICIVVAHFELCLKLMYVLLFPRIVICMHRIFLYSQQKFLWARMELFPQFHVRYTAQDFCEVCSRTPRSRRRFVHIWGPNSMSRIWCFIYVYVQFRHPFVPCAYIEVHLNGYPSLCPIKYCNSQLLLRSSKLFMWYELPIPGQCFQNTRKMWILLVEYRNGRLEVSHEVLSIFLHLIFSM